MGECFVRTGNCLCCGKYGHKVNDCPMVKDRGLGSTKAQASSPKLDAPKKNHFYEHRSKCELEITPMLSPYIINVID